MSAFGKAQPATLHGFNNSARTYPESSYPYLATAYGSQASVSSAVTAPVYPHAANQLAQLAYSNAPRPTYDDQSGPYLNVGSTPAPQVTSFSPRMGATGSKMSVYITTLYELLTTNQPVFYLGFGRWKAAASVSRLSQQGGVCSYAVTTLVPDISDAGWSPAQVPVSLYVETGDGDLIAKVDVGTFTYSLGGGVGESVLQDVSRKRKISDGSVESVKSPVKRISNPHLQQAKDEFGAYGYTTTDSTPYSPYMPPSTSYGNMMPQYNRSAGYQGHSASRSLGYNYSSASVTSPTIKAQSPQGSSWNSAYSTSEQSLARSPGASTGSAISRPSLSLPSPSTTANPPLIRTSTLQQTPSPASTPHGQLGQQWNGYALYPHKAQLDIKGDLDTMAQNWSEDEWAAKRRLVHFRRAQSGSTITTSFQPVAPEDRQPNSVCISCIYWEEKNLCFVTSVDTIYLLEQLIAARFTVEEKNRIRRNLEGFRPLTVSKGKADSEEFFKVIMAFPTPKPRNIEKDVKVFHWKDLANALKKIIGKYSASPSSTMPSAPALLTPVSSTGYGTEGSAAGISYEQGPLSPPSASASSSNAYGSSHGQVVTAATAVAAKAQSKAMSAISGGPSDLRVSVPHPHEPSSPWQGSSQQHHMPSAQASYVQQQQQQHSQQHSQQQASRGAWDMAAYLEHSPSTAGSSRAHGGGSSIAAVSTGASHLGYGSSLADIASSSSSMSSRGADHRMARSLTTTQASQPIPRT